MRSVLRLVLGCAVVPLLLSLHASPAVASEACPNEQLRAESNIDPATAQPYSDQLPDCRAYELVSPPETGGWEAPSPKLVAGAGIGHAVTANGTVFFESQATPAGTGAIENGRYERVFRSARTSAGWVTHDIFPTSTPGNIFLWNASSDGSRVLVKTTISLSSEDLDNPTDNTSETGQDFYVIEGGVAPLLVTHGELPDTEQPTAGGSVFTNPELTAVGFISGASLSRPALSGHSTAGCYIWTDSGPRLAILTNQLETNSPTPPLNCALLGVAADGRAIIKNESAQEGEVGALYATINAEVQFTSAVQLSAPTAHASVVALSPNGEIVYIETEEKLTANAAADTGSDIYAINLTTATADQALLPHYPPEAITCISCEAGGMGNGNGGEARWVAQSADGSHEFFTVAGVLYEHDASGTAELAAETGIEASQIIPSQNGQYAIAEISKAPLASNGTHDVYEFSAGVAPVLIASSSEPGFFHLAGVSDDGRSVVYGNVSSSSPSVIDEWDEGQTGQVSPAVSAHSYQVFATAGPELEDVFFEAHDPLVAQDLNAGTTDIYDARLDGGFPAPTEPTNSNQTTNPTPPVTTSYSANLVPPSLGIPALGPDTSIPATAAKPRALTKPQDLSQALKACKRDRSKPRREMCERSARKKYAPAGKKARK